MSVEEVFDKFVTLYPDLDLDNASGYPSDCSKRSDVDIALFLPNRVENLFEGFTVEHYNGDVIYTTDFMGREVNVYTTTNVKTAARGVTHRKNEIKLAEGRPLLLAEVIKLKCQGIKTEPAWIQAMGLIVKCPYEAMLEDLTELAELREAELRRSQF